MRFQNLVVFIFLSYCIYIFVANIVFSRYPPKVLRLFCQFAPNVYAHSVKFRRFLTESLCFYTCRTDIGSSSDFRRHLQICRTNPRLQHYKKGMGTARRYGTVCFGVRSPPSDRIRFEQERRFDYSKVDRNGLVSHIAKFVSGLWQIHPFGEGNTRTTAVFTILYLRSMGFDVTNDLFAKHSWYFRNALVRANYQNVQKGIMRNSEYLERFFRNLLLGETNELRNRYMVVNAPEELRAKQVQRIDRTSTEQPAVQVTEQVRALLLALSNEQLSLKVLMEKVGLKHRPTFLENYITPASEAGFLKVLYPDKPNHPKQKYLLTTKGLALYNEIKQK